MKVEYVVVVSDVAVYEILADNESDAIERAIEWFDDRRHDVKVVKTEEKDED